MAAEDLRRLESKIEAAAAKSEARKREQMEKREQEKTKRLAAAEAVQEARQQAHVSTIKKGLEKASRACAAVTAREKKVAEVVKRTGAQVVAAPPLPSPDSPPIPAQKRWCELSTHSPWGAHSPTCREARFA